MKWSGAGRNRGERERSVERQAAEWRAGVTKIGLSAERQIGRSRSAHAPLTCSDQKPGRVTQCVWTVSNWTLQSN